MQVNKLRKAWVAALRSGKYTQGKHALRPQDEQFCCLGVLCDIVDPKRWSLGGDEYNWGFANKEGAVEEKYLTDDVLEAIGLDTSDIDLLAEANDQGKPFEEIATMIEEMR
jgi:hypothetical protein